MKHLTILFLLFITTSTVEAACTITVASPNGSVTRPCDINEQLDFDTRVLTPPVQVLPKIERLKSTISTISSLALRQTLYSAVNAYMIGDTQTAQDIVNSTSLTQTQKDKINSIFVDQN